MKGGRCKQRGYINCRFSITKFISYSKNHYKEYLIHPFSPTCTYSFRSRNEFYQNKCCRGGRCSREPSRSRIGFRTRRKLHLSLRTSKDMYNSSYFNEQGNFYGICAKCSSCADQERFKCSVPQGGGCDRSFYLKCNKKSRLSCLSRFIKRRCRNNRHCCTKGKR